MTEILRQNEWIVDNSKLPENLRAIHGISSPVNEESQVSPMIKSIQIDFIQNFVDRNMVMITETAS
jgi:hypothetical protein